MDHDPVPSSRPELFRILGMLWRFAVLHDVWLERWSAELPKEIPIWSVGALNSVSKIAGDSGEELESMMRNLFDSKKT